MSFIKNSIFGINRDPCQSHDEKLPKSSLGNVGMSAHTTCYDSPASLCILATLRSLKQVCTHQATCPKLHAHERLITCCSWLLSLLNKQRNYYTQESIPDLDNINFPSIMIINSFMFRLFVCLLTCFLIPNVLLILQKENGPIMIPKTALKSGLLRGK